MHANCEIYKQETTEISEYLHNYGFLDTLNVIFMVTILEIRDMSCKHFQPSQNITKWPFYSTFYHLSVYGLFWFSSPIGRRVVGGCWLAAGWGSIWNEMKAKHNKKLLGWLHSIPQLREEDVKKILNALWKRFSVLNKALKGFFLFHNVC